MGDYRKVQPLKCAVQQYAWGKVGSEAQVAQLSMNNPDFQVDHEKPYAELWMGTHPKGPSALLNEGKSLSEWIHNNPQCLGKRVREAFNGQLPFLFKVLSVNKSLSIQAHPNKAHAAELHSLKPDKYPDPNHKPEMAIALTQFEGLCGFRPFHEIVQFLDRVPEFAEVIGLEASTKFRQAVASSENDLAKQALQECFTKLMTCDENIVKVHLEKLTSRIKEIQASQEEDILSCGELILRLNSQFPGDVGCFCAFMLNHVLLQPGEAMFLGPNLPHAYLAGDCMECMACSDNVVRAGLTPKYKDVQTLCEMLDFNPGSPQENIFPSHTHPGDAFVTIYNPPVDDFTVARIKIPAACSSYTIQALQGPSIAIVIQGTATSKESYTLPSMEFKPGTVLYIPCGSEITVNVSSTGIVIFRAFCELA